MYRVFFYFNGELRVALAPVPLKVWARGREEKKMQKYKKKCFLKLSFRAGTGACGTSSYIYKKISQFIIYNL